MSRRSARSPTRSRARSSAVGELSVATRVSARSRRHSVSTPVEHPPRGPGRSADAAGRRAAGSACVARTTGTARPKGRRRRRGGGRGGRPSFPRRREDEHLLRTGEVVEDRRRQHHLVTRLVGQRANLTGVTGDRGLLGRSRPVGQGQPHHRLQRQVRCRTRVPEPDRILGQRGSGAVGRRGGAAPHRLVVRVPVAPVWRDEQAAAPVTDQLDDRGDDVVVVVTDPSVGKGQRHDRRLVEAEGVPRRRQLRPPTLRQGVGGVGGRTGV